MERIVRLGKGLKVDHINDMKLERKSDDFSVNEKLFI